MAARLIGEEQLPVAQTAWYPKKQASFSDVIAFVRSKLSAARYSVDSLSRLKSTEFNLDLVTEMLDSLAEAA